MFLAGILVESVEDYQSLCDLARCGRELWGLETVVMTHGPRANPGQIEDPWMVLLCGTWEDHPHDLDNVLNSYG